MTDRELLELAAKAAGIAIYWKRCAEDLADLEGRSEHGPFVIGSGILFDDRWNPLTDDGDCGRLEGACLIDVEWQRIGVVAIGPDTDRMREPYADHDGKRQAARRRASVRAAAEIGKAMP